MVSAKVDLGQLRQVPYINFLNLTSTRPAKLPALTLALNRELGELHAERTHRRHFVLAVVEPVEVVADAT